MSRCASRSTSSATPGNAPGHYAREEYTVWQIATKIRRLAYYVVARSLLT